MTDTTKVKRSYSKPNRASHDQSRQSKPLIRQEKKQADDFNGEWNGFSDTVHQSGEGVDFIGQSPARTLREVMESKNSSQSEKINAAKALAVLEMRDGTTASQAVGRLTRDELRAEITRIRGVLAGSAL